MVLTERHSLDSDELLEADRLLSQILDALDVLVVVLDRAGRIVLFNRACERVSGYNREEVMGRPFVDLLVAPEERESARATQEELLAEPTSFNVEHWWVAKDGERHRIRWSAERVEDEEHSICNVVGVGLDVTRLRELEGEVINVGERLRQRFGQELHDMLASQLAGTAMMASAFTRRSERGDVVKTGDLRRLTELVRDGADQVRMLSHSFVAPEMEAEELGEVLSSLAERTEAAAGIDCPCIVCPEAPVAVPTSDVALHLYRIAQEALHNAITHAHPARVVVSLAYEADSTGGDVLVLSVCDDGCGMPEDATGGLGLANMRRRARRIGGSLRVEAAETGGTLVRCTVPLPVRSVDTDPPGGHALDG